MCGKFSIRVWGHVSKSSQKLISIKDLHHRCTWDPENNVLAADNCSYDLSRHIKNYHANSGVKDMLGNQGVFAHMWATLEHISPRRGPKYSWNVPLHNRQPFILYGQILPNYVTHPWTSGLGSRAFTDKHGIEEKKLWYTTLSKKPTGRKNASNSNSLYLIALYSVMHSL